MLHSGEVHDAGIFGASCALRAALSIRQNNEKIFVFLDNQVAVMALRAGKSSISIQLARLFHSLATSVNAELRWVPGHLNIGGNEEADAEAHFCFKIFSG